MNRAILVVLVAAIFSVISCWSAEPEKLTTKELAELIHSLPRRENVDEFGMPRAKSANHEETQAERDARLKKAIDGFRRLKALFRVGTSVFDYPGLIALSCPQHDAGENSYEMILGIRAEWFRSPNEGTSPDEFWVCFDGRGIITRIDRVIYKK